MPGLARSCACARLCPRLTWQQARSRVSSEMMRNTAARLARIWWLILGIMLLPSARLLAHPSPNSAVLLDFHRDAVTAELVLPLNELELSFGQPLTPDPAGVVARHGMALKAYVLAHVHPKAPDGRPWSVQARDDMTVKLNEQPADLVVHLWMRPPEGAPLRVFTLDYDVVAHEVMSHRAFVFIRNDWNSARFANQQPEAVGMIHFQEKSVKIDRTQGSWRRGFDSVVRLGIRHIAEGTDHLLFLLVLLLPAPLLVNGKRWGRYGGLKRSLWRLFKIVTAFTIGHSITLAIGAIGWVKLPGQPVEILIAVSILVSAVHAIRPVFPGREPLIAAGFGLVHGLAFAGSIAEFGFSPWYMALSILGFNLGIELMQMVVVAATIPWLLLLSRTRFYPPVRLAGAIFGGIAALAWIGERAFSWPNPMNAFVGALARHSLWMVALLAAMALLATWSQRGKAATE
jgi:hypothetical protein